MVDSYGGQGDVNAILKTTIGIYTSTIKIAQDRTKSRIYVLSPFSRPHPTWLRDHIAGINDVVKTNLQGVQDVEVLPSLVIPEQLFEADKMHLNHLGLSMYHAHLMAVCGIFKRIGGSVSRESVSEETTQERRKRAASPLKSSQQTKRAVNISQDIDMGETSEEDNVNITIQSNQQASVISAIRETMAAEFAKFTNAQSQTNKQVSANFKIVSKEMFLHGEDIDEAKNRANANVLLITGLKGVIPKDRRAKNNLASKVAYDFTKQIGAGRVQIMYATFIPGPPPQPGCLPMLKLACGSQGDAHLIRTIFNGERKTKPQEYDSIYLTPEQEKSTRVRASVLLALTRKREFASLVKDAKPVVNRYDHKPDITFRHTKTGKIEKRMSYYEAMEKYGKILTAEDLVIPKKIAGKSFLGRMKTMFMLSES